MNNRAAVITGSSRGIGKAIAVQLARDGYRVVVNYLHNQAKAEQLIQEIQAAGVEAIAVAADVSTAEGAQNLIDETLSAYGQIDVLVNNAGINRDQLILRMSDSDWQEVINTNLSSAFFCSRAALKHMVRKRYGRIISISSVVGLNGNPGQTHYAAAKAGLLGLSSSIAKEYGGRGINANVIAPGYIKSDMTANLNEAQTKRLLETIAVNRIGQPEDIAQVASFLVSPGADYITAQCIRVDGGMSGF